MANTIQIAVTLDEKGVVTGVANVNTSLDKIPAHAKPAFEGISKGQLEARNALNELSYAFGIQLPGEMSKAISKVPLLAGALTTLGETAAIGAVVAGFVEIASHIDDAQAKLHGFERDLADVYQRSRNVVTNSIGIDDIQQQSQKDLVDKYLTPFVDGVQTLKDKAEAAGKEGVSAIAAQAAAELAALKQANETLLSSTLADRGSDLADPIYQRVATQAARTLADGELAIEQQKDAQIAKLRKDTLDQIQQQQQEADEAGLTGFQLAIKQEQDAIDRRNKALTRVGVGNPDVLKSADAAISSKTTEQIELQGKQWSEQIDNMVAQAQQSSAQGFYAIDIKIGAEQQKLIEDFTKQWGNFDPYPTPKNQFQLAREADWLAAGNKLQEGLTAVAKSGDDQRTRLMLQNNDAVADAAADAARSTLPPWLQANQSIIDNFNKTNRSIEEQFLDTKLTKPQADALYGSALKQENADLVKNFQQTRDELAGQINSVFDDITSGNLTQAVLAELKHLFSEILAQWLLTLNGMRAAGGSGGQGGILGSIFGSLFGGKSSSGSSLGDFGQLVPSFGDAGSLASVAPIAAVAASGLLSGLQSPFSLASGTGLTAGLTSPFAASGLSVGAGLSAGVGTASAVQQQTANSLVGSTLEQSLAKFFPHGVTVGGLKISGSELAGVGAGVGLSSLLYGYQSGSPVLGGLGGAAGGALAGFSFGGPLGAVIGGAIGGIGGLLSGIFGGQKRHDEAETLIQGTLGPQIAAILQSYDTFSTDQQDAMSQLTDLENQAKQQLDQLGQDKLYWSELVPQVNSATDKINQIQGVRDQRSALNFAPPEFATGGTVPGFGPVPIIAHGGEEIIRNPYSNMFRSAFKAINANGIPLNVGPSSEPQPHVEMHYHINAMDSGDVQKFFDKHGRSIRQSIRRDMLLNWNGGQV